VEDEVSDSIDVRDNETASARECDIDSINATSSKLLELDEAVKTSYDIQQRRTEKLSRLRETKIWNFVLS
jgi:hypothetical protein